MPEFAERLWRALGYQDPIWQAGWPEEAPLVPVGQRVELAETAFFPNLTQEALAQSA